MSSKRKLKRKTHKEEQLVKKYKKFQSELEALRTPVNEAASNIKEQKKEVIGAKERCDTAQEAFEEAQYERNEARSSYGSHKQDLEELIKIHKTKQKDLERFCIDNAQSAIAFAVFLKDGLPLNNRIRDCLRILSDKTHTAPLPELLPDLSTALSPAFKDMTEVTGLIPSLSFVVYNYAYFATCPTCYQPLHEAEDSHWPELFYMDTARTTFIIRDYTDYKCGWKFYLLRNACFRCAVLMSARMFYEAQLPDSPIGTIKESFIDFFKCIQSRLSDSTSLSIQSRPTIVSAAFRLVYQGERDERIFGKLP